MSDHCESFRTGTGHRFMHFRLSELLTRDVMARRTDSTGTVPPTAATRSSRIRAEGIGLEATASADEFGTIYVSS